MSVAKRVLFLCTGNSCRSQMAEAIVNSGKAGNWTALSAGSRPAGFVHPLAIRVLAEVGVEVPSAARSKPVSELRGQAFDLVVTVCSSAAEQCPVWLGQGRRVHQEYPDPAKAQGDEGRILASFRAVRDDLLRDIPALLERASRGGL